MVYTLKSAQYSLELIIIKLDIIILFASQNDDSVIRAEAWSLHFKMQLLKYKIIVQGSNLNLIQTDLELHAARLGLHLAEDRMIK